MKNICKAVIAISVFMFTSCESLLDINNPNDAVIAEDVFTTNEETVAAAANALYTLSFNGVYYYRYFEQYLGHFSDDLHYSSTTYDEAINNEYTPLSAYISYYWDYPYDLIYTCNNLIENIKGNKFIDDATENIYIGESHFFRAYSYFWLVNMFGDVPLITSTNVEENNNKPRTDKAEIWKLIIEDLKMAESLLADNEFQSIKVSAHAAKALLARVYLYNDDWTNAAAKANELIPAADGGSSSLSNLQLETTENVFKASSKESILAGNNSGANGAGSYDGYTRIVSYITSASTAAPSVRLNPETASLILDDANDSRSNWISVHSGNLYGVYKYKNRSTPSSKSDYEYHTMLRLAEQYLIRAEAKAMNGDLTGAINDVNIIRSRAGISALDVAGMNKDAVIDAILLERRKELFFEQGHRWFDVNRTGRGESVFGAITTKDWSAHKSLLPVPEEQISINRKLEQNEGYN